MNLAEKRILLTLLALLITTTNTTPSSFDLPLTSAPVEFNATLLVYNTHGNSDPSDDTLFLTASLSDLPANGTTHDFGYLGSLNSNQTYLVELRLQPNATYNLDADYFDETFIKAGYPFSTWDNSTRGEYLINTTLVTNDSTRGEDIFVSQSSGVDYSVDSNVGEAGMIQGDPDVVVLEKTNERTYWFENPDWSAVQIENADPNAAQVRALAVGDLERDGDVDVVVGNDYPNILIYENDGTPEGANWNYQDIGTPSDTVRALAVADLDNDGYPDIISGESATSLRVYQNDGTPFNSAWSTVKTVDSGFADKIETLATGDMDRDGYIDIVTGEGFSVFWYQNPGDPFGGSWSKYNIDTSLNDKLKSIALGDLDGDGDLDVVVTTKNDDVVIYENDGTPTGWGGSSYTVKSSAGGDVEDSIVGDIDGDEVPDIAVVVKTAYDVLWFKNDGTPFDGGWSEYTVDSSTGGQDPKYIAGGDIDSDGDLDLVVGVAGKVDDVYWYENSNPTSGEWTVNVIKSLADDPRGVAVIDIDRDANHNVLDYYVSSSENIEEGADEFGGWSSLSAAQNYSFYFIVTPDNNWGVDGVNDNVTFYLGNESDTGFTESRVHSAIRYPFKIKWTWNAGGVTQTNVTLNATVLDESGLLNVTSRLYKEDGTTLENSTTGSSFNFTGKTRYYVEVDARDTKNISARFKVNDNWSDATVTLEKYSSNPHGVDPPGTPVKYVNLSAVNANYSEVSVSVSYTDSEVEVGNVVENIRLYQYNGTGWEGLTTTGSNNNRTATITSFNTIALVANAPTITSNSKWKMSFNTLLNPYEPEGTWYPEVKLYWQNGSVAKGQTVYYQAYCVNHDTLLASGTATDTGAGEYYFSVDTTGHKDHYIRVRFNTTVGSNSLVEERSVLVRDDARANGVPWKIVWRNASDKATFDASESVPVIVELWGDSGGVLKNRNLYLFVNDSTGNTLINNVQMSDNDDGTYTYTISPGVLSNGDDYHFQVYTLYKSKKTNKKYAYAFSDRYREAVSQGDVFAPDLWDLIRSPVFPQQGANVTISAKAQDDMSMDSVTLYYRVNGQGWNSTAMSLSSGVTYTANLGSFFAEDKVEYYVKATDTSGNYRKSSIEKFFVDMAASTPSSAYVYLDQSTYYFGKKTGSWSDNTGVSGHSSDGVIFPDADRATTDVAWRRQIMEMNTIRAFALVLDEKGRPVDGLTNVRFWITNDTGYNLSKNGTDLGNGRYAAVFYGSKDENGDFTADDIGGPADTSVDGNAMWGKFTSRRNYWVNVSIDGDLIPEAQARWMAYTWLDTFFGQDMAGEGASHCEGKGCSSGDSVHRDQHYNSSGERQDRADNPACQDCHGWNEGYTGSLGPGTNGVRYPGLDWGNVHPRQNQSGAADCTDSSCHGGTWYDAGQPIPADMVVPGYDDGTYNITDEYYDPGRCGECHNYSLNVQPGLRGHNLQLGCKYCHRTYHNINYLVDYNATQLNGTPGYAEVYAGDCYKDCHKVQEKHSGTVACSECHVNFETSPQHQSNLTPIMDTCTYCHQNASYEYAGARPPQIPVINHTTSTDGIWSVAMGYERRYWYSQEYACRYCHGRTFNQNPGLGRPASFNGTNIQNQTIGNGTWCASCHYQGYTSGNHTYSDMVNIYNTSLGKVPPEITGNTSYAPTTSPENRTYINHTIFNIASNYTDARCMNCHGAHLTTLTINAFMHNVSFDSDPPTASFNQTPSDVKNNTTGSITINATLDDGIGSGVNTSVNPHLWYRINDTGSESWTDNGEMSYLSGTTWTTTIPDQSWSSQLNKTLEYYLSNMTDRYGNTGNSTIQTDFIQDHNNQPPSVPVLITPIGGENWSGTQNITWGNSTDDGRTPFTVNYDVDYLYDNTWTDLAAPATNSTQWDTTVLDDGTYKIRVRAYDGAEYSNFNASGNFTVDNTPPTAIFNQTPSNLTDVSFGSINISVTLSDALSGINTTATPRLWYLLDNGTTTSYTDGGLMTYISGTTWNASIPDQNLSNQSGATLKYYVSGMRDGAGNTGNSTVQSDYIDPVAGPSKTATTLKVVTNRPVILDDPNNGRATAGYATPPTNWGTDWWNGEDTTIRIYALLLDGEGLGIADRNLTITIKYPDGSNLTTLTARTDSTGLASTSYDLNGRNFYGTWTVDVAVEDSSLTGQTTFIYNWWGCALCHGKKGNPPWSGSSSSPYTNGWDSVVNEKRDHYQHTNKGFPDNDCTHCHQSYDGLPGGTKTAAFNNYPAGYHSSKQCSDSTCHDSYTTHRSDMDIGSCNDCHSREELSSKSTLDASSRSIYSDTNPASGSPLKYHDPDASIPCILCHQPMHNITSPYPQGRGNTVTESEQCTSCHGLSKHNNTVECTTCHTQDAHAVKYFNATGGNTTLKAEAGSCDTCHINTTLDSRFAVPPPKVSAVLNHSNAEGAGKLWGSYWTGQSSACIYCHSDTKHKTSALGRPSQWRGDNTVNQSITGGSWCASCHYQSYTSGNHTYTNMTTAFLGAGLNVPPAITPGSYYPSGSPYDHSGISGFTDDVCYTCHNGTSNYNYITQFMHNTTRGLGGGADCVGCHGLGGSAPIHIDAANISNSVHANLNSNATNTTELTDPIDKACWACHGDGSEPSEHPDNYKSPRGCEYCHTSGLYNATLVSEHIPVESANIETTAYCSTCHNNSIQSFNNSDSRTPTSNETTAHYATTTNLINSISGPEGCVYCHENSTAAALWGGAGDPRNSTQRAHDETENRLCYTCHLDNATIPESFHNDTIIRLHTPTPPQNVTGNPVLNLTVNRWVILDDPNSGSAGSGFSNPPRNWNSDYWSGESTAIRMYALTMNSTGRAVSTQVTFTLKNPGGSTIYQNTVTSSVEGIASDSYNVNAQNYYGYWTVTATATIDGVSLSKSARFTYEWWGCADCHGREDPSKSGTTTSSSPYLHGYDPIVSKKTQHQTTCTTCHRGYTPAGEHTGKSCTDCHSDITTHKTDETIPDCYGCHPQNNYNLTQNSTLIGDSSVYSYNTTNGPLKAHTPSDTIPCIICHNPMHNITLPYPSGGGNTVTESDHCAKCHLDRRHSPSNPVDCTLCHSQDAHVIKYISNTTNATSVNYTRTAQGTVCTDCHTDTGLRDYLAGQGYNPPWRDTHGFNITKHAGIIDCKTCHDNLHWIGYLNRTGRYQAVNNSQVVDCDACHRGNNSAVNSIIAYWGYLAPIKNRHNGTVFCEICHNYSKHGARYLNQQFNGFIENKSLAVNCTGCHQDGYNGAPQVNKPLNHSENQTGQRWGSYWTTQNGGCEYCHSNTLHNTTALGRVSEFAGENTVNQTIDSNGTWCLSCHYQNYTSGTATYTAMIAAFTFEGSPVPPEITGNTSYGADQSNPSYFNHTSIPKNDQACRNCHGGNLPLDVKTTGLMHNLTTGGGGPDCIGCHDIGGYAPYHVNVSVMNSTDAIHRNLNSDASATVDADNKRCWACHGDGSQPSDHPSNYRTPYQCPDCHVDAVGRNTNYSPNNTVMLVDEHYWNGTNITTDVTSCYACHNRSEMMLPGGDPDNGSGSVYGGANGGNLSVSHYGRKRGDLAGLENTTGYCGYCHQNTSTTFPVTHTSMNNHTVTGTPGCNDANCHVGGRIHNSTLDKTMRCVNCHTDVVSELVLGYNNNSAPTGRNMTLPRDTIVSGLAWGEPPAEPLASSGMYARHANPNSTGGNPAGAARDPNYICLNCHSDIIRANGDWRNQNWDTEQGCKTCHYLWYSVAVYRGVMLTMMPNAHNLSIPRCTDCHTQLTPTTFEHEVIDGDPPKNYGRVPRIGLWLNSSVHYRMTLNTTSSHPTSDRGCLVCHTGVNFTINYTASPINITINSYNGSHLWDSKPYCTKCHYINGSQSGVAPSPVGHQGLGLVDGNNSQCKRCHSQTNNHGHDLARGSWPDCVDCHDLGGVAPKVNLTAMKLGVHAGLNSNVGNTTELTDPLDKACWACHGDGSEPTVHLNNLTTVSQCEDCHLQGSFNATIVSDHRQNGEVNTTASCIDCHNRSLTAFYNTTLTSNLTGLYNTSHYANKSNLPDTYDNSQGCVYCHVYNQSWGGTNITSTTYPRNHSERNNSQCWGCHIDGNITVSSFHNESLNPGWGECTDCHFDYSYMSNKNTTVPGYLNASGADKKYVNQTMYSSAVHATLNCTDCHTAGNRSQHPPEEYTWKWCEDCHVYQEDPVNNTNRHNITSNPRDITIAGVNPVTEKDCTTCHNSEIYNNTKNNYNSTAEINCRYCHTLPDEVFE